MSKVLLSSYLTLYSGDFFLKGDSLSLRWFWFVISAFFCIVMNNFLSWNFFYDIHYNLTVENIKFIDVVWKNGKILDHLFGIILQEGMEQHLCRNYLCSFEFARSLLRPWATHTPTPVTKPDCEPFLLIFGFVKTKITQQGLGSLISLCSLSLGLFLQVYKIQSESESCL